MVTVVREERLAPRAAAAKHGLAPRAAALTRSEAEPPNLPLFYRKKEGSGHRPERVWAAAQGVAAFAAVAKQGLAPRAAAQGASPTSRAPTTRAKADRPTSLNSQKEEGSGHRPERVWAAAQGASQYPHAIAAIALIALLTLAHPAAAQGFDMGGGGGAPMEVLADQGVEWSQDGKKFIARGNAKAIRNKVTVNADTLTALYREAKKGTEVYRIEADGNVRITSTNETATGTRGTYDIDESVMILTGGPPKLVTPTDTVTAVDALEYWDTKKMAVARGHAVATHLDKRIQADVLNAYFVDVPKKGLQLTTAKAVGNVVITTEHEVVTGERGDYNAEAGIATVTGSVKITREQNQLNGSYAVVNLNTGVSRLFAAAPGSAGEGTQRVQGLFMPEHKDGAEGGDGKKDGKPGATPAGSR